MSNKKLLAFCLIVFMSAIAKPRESSAADDFLIRFYVGDLLKWTPSGPQMFEVYQFKSLRRDVSGLRMDTTQVWTETIPKGLPSISLGSVCMSADDAARWANDIIPAGIETVGNIRDALMDFPNRFRGKCSDWAIGLGLTPP